MSTLTFALPTSIQMFLFLLCKSYHVFMYIVIILLLFLICSVIVIKCNVSFYLCRDYVSPLLLMSMLSFLYIIVFKCLCHGDFMVFVNH